MHTRSPLTTPQHALLLPFLTGEKKREQLKSLHNLYRKGTEHTPADEEKALFYLALRLQISLPDDYTTITLKWFSWFTTWRLFLIRDAREHNVFQHIYSVSCFGYTNILQFSYGLELIPCLFQLYNNPAIASDNEWQSTVTNALAWLIINGCSYATGYAWINLIGFAFDIGHDWYYTKNEIESLNTLLRESSDIDNHTKIAIDARIKELQYKQMRVTLVAIGIFIGMVIFYLNPIAPAWVPIVGASLVILFGVIIGNLGNRLLQWDKLLVNLFSHDSFTQVCSDELTAIHNSIKKLFKELIKPLSPTLYNNLENITENPCTALSSIIFAALPTVAFIYACSHFSALLCLASAHLLITIGIILVATELSVRLCNYFSSQPENAGIIDSIIGKLSPINNDNNKNEQEHSLTDSHNSEKETHFNAFSKLDQKEFETLAKLAELSVKELLQHINCWDNTLGENQSSQSSENSTPRVSNCRYSFSTFKKAINDAKEKPLKNNSQSYRLAYP